MKTRLLVWKTTWQLTDLYKSFPDLFKPSLGLLREFKLQVKYKSGVKPVDCKPRTVPFAIQENPALACEARVCNGIRKRIQFRQYGDTVVPLHKTMCFQG
jgi:hypothetical protein